MGCHLTLLSLKNIDFILRKDLLGPEFFDHVLDSNQLLKIRDIHFLCQYMRGNKRLTKAFAKHVIAFLPALEHFGNFHFWEMTHKDIRDLDVMVR